MASVVIGRRRRQGKNHGTNIGSAFHQKESVSDRCESMIMTSIEDVDQDIDSTYQMKPSVNDVPTGVAADVLMGKMPATDSSIKFGELLKLTSKHEWKPVKVVLTHAGLYLGQPEEV